MWTSGARAGRPRVSQRASLMAHRLSAGVQASRFPVKRALPIQRKCGHVVAASSQPRIRLPVVSVEEASAVETWDRLVSHLHRHPQKSLSTGGLRVLRASTVLLVSVVPQCQSSFCSPGIATNSTPPTPQMGRRKLELLPRATGASAGPSPLSSPRMAHSPSGSSTPRSNPFGDARYASVQTQNSNAHTCDCLGQWMCPQKKRKSRTAWKKIAK
jgi:hypothetical protein